ncbi:MAG: NirD/YgiW/YdeI family stress tolerance protein [Lentisphaerota bacterium]
MAKIIKFAIICCCLLTSVYLSAESRDSDQTLNTVASAKQADNKAQVILTGVIIQRDGNYFLRDLTGQIKLDFPPSKNITIVTNQKVKITGKIKTNLLRLVTKSVEPTVRVRSLEVIQNASEVSADSAKKL